MSGHELDACGAILGHRHLQSHLFTKPARCRGVPMSRKVSPEAQAYPRLRPACSGTARSAVRGLPVVSPRRPRWSRPFPAVRIVRLEVAAGRWPRRLEQRLMRRRTAMTGPRAPGRPRTGLAGRPARCLAGPLRPPLERRQVLDRSPGRKPARLQWRSTRSGLAAAVCPQASTRVWHRGPHPGPTGFAAGRVRVRSVRSRFVRPSS